MDDIAANLKGYCHCDVVPGVKCAPCKAADEIKRLRARCAELEGFNVGLATVEARLDAAICLHLSLDPDGPGNCTDRLVAAVEDAGKRLRAYSVSGES